MQAKHIKLNGYYQLKPTVLESSVGVDGQPLSPDVVIICIKAVPTRKKLWYFDARGNAYRAEDFLKPTEVIEIEL